MWDPMATDISHASKPAGTSGESERILDAFRALHAGLREQLGRPVGNAARAPTVSRNPKGDVQQAFDVLADRWVREWLRDHFASGVILSEETSAPDVFGSGDARYRFVVDPVDGSDNHGRALPLSALAVALLPPDGPIAVERVTHALVGGLRDHSCVVAARGGGACSEEGTISTSSAARIEQALVSCELSHWAPDPALATLLARCRGVRSYGSAAQAVALVARGALDAHVDVRERLTPESFLAASLVLREAGGYVCTLRGAPLPAFQSLLQRSTLVAAATPGLAEEIVDALG